MTNYCSFSITSLAVPWSSVHGKVKFNDHNLCTFTSSSQCLTRPSVCHHTRPEWDLVVINWLLGTMKSPSGSAVLLVESPMCLCMHACVSVCVCVVWESVWASKQVGGSLTFRSQFSPSTKWGLGIELRPSG